MFSEPPAVETCLPEKVTLKIQMSSGRKGPFGLFDKMKIILREPLKHAEKSLSDRQMFQSSKYDLSFFSFGEFRNVWSGPRSWFEQSVPPSKDSLFLFSLQ